MAARKPRLPGKLPAQRAAMPKKPAAWSAKKDASGKVVQVTNPLGRTWDYRTKSFVTGTKSPGQRASMPAKSRTERTSMPRKPARRKGY